MCVVAYLSVKTVVRSFSRWSRREEQDFARVISFYGVEFNRKLNKYDWAHFRHLASLTKKSDERLTLYLHDFKQMCWRVLKKKKVRHGERGGGWRKGGGGRGYSFSVMVQVSLG